MNKTDRAPKVRHIEYRTFGAHREYNTFPDLTVGPTLWRLFEAANARLLQKTCGISRDGGVPSTPLMEKSRRH